VTGKIQWQWDGNQVSLEPFTRPTDRHWERPKSKYAATFGEGLLHVTAKFEQLRHDSVTMKSYVSQC
jgi:hypothetical protein